MFVYANTHILRNAYFRMNEKKQLISKSAAKKSKYLNLLFAQFVVSQPMIIYYHR
jgi:hypothetical protein